LELEPELPAKYGAALTGSDWPGLPLRIGHVPESGRVEDLSGHADTVLVWVGGPSNVSVIYVHPVTGADVRHDFERRSGMVDLLPGTIHMKSVTWEGRPSTCTSVNFPEACLEALCAEPASGFDATLGPQYGLVDAHIVDLVLRLQGQAEGKEYLGALYVQSLSLALASYVLARYGARAERLTTSKAPSLSKAQCTQIKLFVEEELANNFGLVDLAGLVGYSPDHFSRLFKQAFEQSPHQYVLSRRIERAMGMLRDENLSIAEIALACGFSNQGHFTTVFKQRTGSTPGAFRKA
jgi:AraC family transcriptional regulator